ncbi:MAG: DUF523 domain-containing protein [Methylococcales bacterium]
MKSWLGTFVKVGISSCLLGEKVRYDGSHKRNDLIIETLGVHFILVPFCPEVAIGMGVPREPVQLVNGISQRPEARGVFQPDHNFTVALKTYSDDLSPQIELLSGYVFKSRSPSCGISSVDVYTRQGQPTGKTASGIFAGKIIASYPLLPVIEDDPLNNTKVREKFIERVFEYYHQQSRDIGREHSA